MSNSDEKVAGLSFLQSIVSRMANNSFYIKGWDLTLFVAIIALKKDITHYGNYLFIALFVSSVMFFFLDAYYLQQERIFRKIYNYLAEKDVGDTNFFKLNPSCYIEDFRKQDMDVKKLSYCDALSSRAHLMFHIPLIAFVFLFFIFSN